MVEIMFTLLPKSNMTNYFSSNFVWNEYLGIRWMYVVMERWMNKAKYVGGNEISMDIMP